MGTHDARTVVGAVRFVPRSMNRKLGPVRETPGRRRPHRAAVAPYVSSTLVSIRTTCPDACVFKGTTVRPGGCYVNGGFTRIKMQRLDRAAWGTRPLAVIAEEARQINTAFGGGPIPQDGRRGGRDLRLHVGGDVEGAESAALLAKAARRWRARGGGGIWTYTHAWRVVPRDAWGDAISVLASVERAEDIELARAAGYAAAIVVEDFPNGAKAFRLAGASSRVVPCPAETQGRTCVECRLCIDRDLFAMDTAIAFKVHGQHQAAARDSLRGGSGDPNERASTRSVSPRSSGHLSGGLNG